MLEWYLQQTLGVRLGLGLASYFFTIWVILEFLRMNRGGKL